MVAWRLQSSKYPLINSEGARITGGRWNRPGTSIIYASDSILLAALEVMVHHAGIPEDYAGIRIDIPDDIEIAVADVPDGWPNVVPEAVTAAQGSEWVEAGKHAVLQVPSATMSLSGFNYLLNPAHPDFQRISFTWHAVEFHPGLRPSRR